MIRILIAIILLCVGCATSPTIYLKGEEVAKVENMPRGKIIYTDGKVTLTVENEGVPNPLAPVIETLKKVGKKAVDNVQVSLPID